MAQRHGRRIAVDAAGRPMPPRLRGAGHLSSHGDLGHKLPTKLGTNKRHAHHVQHAHGPARRAAI
eukprot:2672186-Pyramimonas_sp.AAC.1